MASPLALALLLATAPRESPAPPLVAIQWEKKFDEALKKAKRAGKPLVVDFWAEWCGWCHRLDRTTYADPAVIRRAQEFVAVKVNTEGSRRELEVSAKYGVRSLPTILFLSPQGRQLFRVNGFQGPGQFPRTLDAARQVARPRDRLGERRSRPTPTTRPPRSAWAGTSTSRSTSRRRSACCAPPWPTTPGRASASGARRACCSRSWRT